MAALLKHRWSEGDGNADSMNNATKPMLCLRDSAKLDSAGASRGDIDVQADAIALLYHEAWHGAETARAWLWELTALPLMGPNPESGKENRLRNTIVFGDGDAPEMTIKSTNPNFTNPDVSLTTTCPVTASRPKPGPDRLRPARRHDCL